METFGRITPNVPLRFKNKQEHIEGLDCEVPGCDHPSQSDYLFDRGGHEWMIGTCKHHDHVEHALQALNQHIEQMTPIVNAAAETKDKKYMYNSYEPEDYDYLEEASKREYVDKVGEVTDPEYDGPEDHEDVIKAAEAEHGVKFANQLRGIGKPREDYGIDPLGRLAGNRPTRVTGKGKANTPDVKALKRRIMARLGVTPVTTNRHGGYWAKTTYVKEEHLDEASIPKHLLRRYEEMVKHYADSIHEKHPDYSDDKKFRIASATAMRVLGVTEEAQEYKPCPHCKGTGEVFPKKDGKPSKVPGICINCEGQGILSPMEEAYQRPPRKITPATTKRAGKKGYDEADAENITRIVAHIRNFNVNRFKEELRKKTRNPTTDQIREYVKNANPTGYPKVKMGERVTILVGSHGDQSEAGSRAGELSNFLMQQGHETQPFVTQGQNGYNYGVRPVMSKPGAKSMKEQLFSDGELDRLEEKLEQMQEGTEEVRGLTRSAKISGRNYSRMQKAIGREPNSKGMSGSRKTQADYLMHRGKELPHILHANGKDVHWKFQPEGWGDMNIHVTTEHEFGEPESATRSRVTNALRDYSRSGYKIPANEVEKGIKALRRMISQKRSVVEDFSDDDLEYLDEAKATYCGRCGTTHVKPSMGGKCPAMKEDVDAVGVIDEGRLSDFMTAYRDTRKQQDLDDRRLKYDPRGTMSDPQSYNQARQRKQQSLVTRVLANYRNIRNKQTSNSVNSSFEVEGDLEPLNESTASPYFNAGRQIEKYANSLSQTNQYSKKVKLHARLLMSPAKTHHKISAENVHRLPDKYRQKILSAVLRHASKTDAQKYLNNAGYKIKQSKQGDQ